MAEQFADVQEFPLAYLRKFGFITAPARDKSGTVRELLGIFGVASVDAFWATWEEGSVAYRRSATARADAPKLATRLALAERHHDGLRDVPAFDRARLEESIPELRRLTTEEPLSAIERAREMLREAGVVLCLVPPVPGLGVYGATRWLHGTPVIQLSLLRRSDDQWWFTLFHEIGHVLLHGETDLHLLGDDTEVEREADAFATETLIPAEYQDRLPRARNLSAVEQLALELGIAPSIVLGQAQRLTGDFAWGERLRRKVEWVPGEGST